MFIYSEYYAKVWDFTSCKKALAFSAAWKCQKVYMRINIKISFFNLGKFSECIIYSSKTNFEKSDMNLQNPLLNSYHAGNYRNYVKDTSFQKGNRCVFTTAYKLTSRRTQNYNTNQYSLKVQYYLPNRFSRMHHYIY